MLMMLVGLGPVVEGGAADADDARWSPAGGGKGGQLMLMMLASCGGRWGS